MNSIPLIKGNTPQEINTSIIALKKALSELEAQDRLLQGTDKGVQDKIKQINELIEGINTHLTAIDSQITALQPVDTVTSDNMHSVTSNAVAGAIYKVSNLQSPIAITFDRTLHLNDWQRVFDISSVNAGEGFNAILSVSAHNASHVENACFLLNISLMHFNIINLSDKPHYSPTSIRVTSANIYPDNVKIDVLCGGYDTYQTYRFTLINLGGILNVDGNYEVGNYSELEHTETLTVG